MKSKRFKDNSILPKGYRKFSCHLKMTWDYLWMNCDEAGVWEIDEDLFEFENNFEFNQDEFLNAFNGLVDCLEDKILIKKFIYVNQCDLGKLNPEYNPHKPVFRAAKKHNISLNPSLNEACFKLVVGVGDVVEVEVEVENFEKSEKLLQIEELKNQIQNEFTWKETFCRNMKEVKPNFKPDDFDNYLHQFFKQLENDADDIKTLKETQKHFSRWLNIEIKKDNESTNNTKTGNSEYKARISKILSGT